MTAGSWTRSNVLRPGRKIGESGLNIFNLVTLTETIMWNDSIGRCGTNGCCSTIGNTEQRCKTLRQSGRGLKTMTALIWPKAGSHPRSGWPWLRKLSTFATLAKGEDYPIRNLNAVTFEPK